MEALAGLFKQVLLCRRAGLVGFGHIALDGTKIKAHASNNKAMGYAGWSRREDALAAEIAAWLDRAAGADAAEGIVTATGRAGEARVG